MNEKLLLNYKKVLGRHLIIEVSSLATIIILNFAIFNMFFSSRLEEYSTQALIFLINTILVVYILINPILIYYYSIIKINTQNVKLLSKEFITGITIAIIIKVISASILLTVALIVTYGIGYILAQLQVIIFPLLVLVNFLSNLLIIFLRIVSIK